MDEIIYLESDEEITSVVDKIKNAHSANVGLVVPRDATLLQSVVNLRLISKEAGHFNKQISIITTDRIGRNLASQIGLPVYGSIREEKPITSHAPQIDHDEVLAVEPEVSPPTESLTRPKGVNIHHFQDSRPIIRWKSQKKPVLNERNEPRSQTERSQKGIERKTFRFLWLLFPFLALLALIGAYLLLPTSSVEIFLKSENLAKSIPIILTESVKNPDPAQNVFPATLLKTIAEKTEKFTTTGKKNLGGKASGTVTFTNGLDSLNHKYSAGTKLLASSKTFVLKNSITIPGATVQNLKVVPGTISAEIEAESAGEDYNIKATKFIIVGLPANQQEALYAQSGTDLKGGFTKEVQVVSKDDFENAKKKLIDELSVQLDENLKTQTNGLKIIEKSMQISDPEITSSADVGSEATDFNLKVKLQKQAMAIDAQKFQDFLVTSLETQVSSGKIVIIPTEDAYGLVVDKTAFDKGELDLTANIQAKIVDKIDTDVIKAKILTNSKSKAENYILSQPGVEKVNFEFQPAWLKRISVLSKNVKVKLNFQTENQ